MEDNTPRTIVLTIAMAVILLAGSYLWVDLLSGPTEPPLPREVHGQR